MQTFFIFALPRSRTTWLSNFLTIGGAICFHDALNVLENSEISELLQGEFYSHMGFAETKPSIYSKVPADILEQSPILVVEQPAEASIEKCAQAFPVMLCEHRALIVPVLTEEAKSLEEIKQRRNCISVGLKDLDRMDTLAEVHDHLLPDIPFDPLRAELLAGMEVNVGFSNFAQRNRQIARMKKAMGFK